MIIAITIPLGVTVFGVFVLGVVTGFFLASVNDDNNL